MKYVECTNKKQAIEVVEWMKKEGKYVYGTGAFPYYYPFEEGKSGSGYFDESKCLKAGHEILTFNQWKEFIKEKKYKISEIKDGEYIVHVHSVEQEKHICEIIGETFGESLKYKDKQCISLSLKSFAYREYWEKNYPLLTIIDYTEIDFEEKEEGLPEKWAFEVNRENYQEIKYLRPLAAPEGWLSSEQGHHPTRKWGTWYLHKPEGFTEISFETFKKHILMEKKLVGYKIKPNCERFIRRFMVWSNLPSIVNGVHLQTESHAHKELEKAGVLDLWCEEVYEDLKPQFKTVAVGNNKTIVTVYKDGKLEFRGEKSSISVVKLLKERFTLSTGVCPSWNAVAKKDVRFILVGCTTENNLFSLNELELILDTHKNLQ